MGLKFHTPYGSIIGYKSSLGQGSFFSQVKHPNWLKAETHLLAAFPAGRGICPSALREGLGSASWYTAHSIPLLSSDPFLHIELGATLTLPWGKLGRGL